jgi:hypothetical protein
MCAPDCLTASNPSSTSAGTTAGALDSSSVVMALSLLNKRRRSIPPPDAPGLGKHLSSAYGEIVFHRPYYRPCDLLAALRGGFDRVGVVSFFGADQPQI